MADKYLLFDLNDEKSKKLGEVISNNTCKKIANFLAEKEASESEIAKDLNLALNTVEYNLKKLLEAGIIEKSKNHFWSEKGKKIEMYKVANKLIVISPKKSKIYSKLKSMVPVILIAAFLTFLISFYYNPVNVIERTADKTLTSVPQAASEGANLVKEASNIGIYYNPGFWFAIGALTILIAFLIWNWRKL